MLNFHPSGARMHHSLQPGATGRPGKVAGLERILPQRVHVLGDRDTSRKPPWVSQQGRGSPTNSASKSTAHARPLCHTQSPGVGVSEEPTPGLHTTVLA